MGLKAKIEAIIYAAEEPITLEQISVLVKDIVLAEEAAAKIAADANAETEALDGSAAPKRGHARRRCRSANRAGAGGRPSTEFRCEPDEVTVTRQQRRREPTRRNLLLPQPSADRGECNYRSAAQRWRNY